jgi:hypothetical protein
MASPVLYIEEAPELQIMCPCLSTHMERPDGLGPPRRRSLEDRVLLLTAATLLQVSNCPSGHSNGPYGENLYFSSAAETNSDPQSWMHSWYNREAGLYDYSNPTFQNGTGNFTKVSGQCTSPARPLAFIDMAIAQAFG